MAEIASLVIGDPPALWASLGFAVDGDAVQVSGVRHVLAGPSAGEGITSWSVRGLPPEVRALDGLAFEPATDAPATDAPATDAPATDAPATDAPATAAEHPNGVVGLDHLVLGTPDIVRTIESFEDIGIECRRTREAGTRQAPMLQAFFRLGPVILEVVGPPDASGDGPLRLSGLAYTVRDLDETARFLGERLRPAKDAVQPGRRIATLDKGVGSTVPLAFMSGEPQRGE